MADRARADRPLREVMVGGGASGLVAGVIMALLAMVGARAAGLGFWTPLRLVAGTLYGPEALSGGAGTVLVGLSLHLLTSAFLGVGYAFLVRPDTPASGSFTGGVLYAVVVWAVMTFTIVPWADPVLATRLQDFGGTWFLLHLAYGAGLAVTPAMERLAVSGRLTPPPRPA